MKLAYWMYAGPAHIGTLRVASSFKNVYAIMHAPIGDDYFNVMRSMLEREKDFTPITTSIVDRRVATLGSKNKVVTNIEQKEGSESPDLVLLTPTCTSSILQEDLEKFVTKAMQNTSGHVLLADVNHYRVNEFQAADRCLEQIVRWGIEKAEADGTLDQVKTETPSVNILGMFTLGFHHHHDYRELKRLFFECGIQINLVIPESCEVSQIATLPKAWFNFVPYREIGLMSAIYLENKFNMPYLDRTPMGLCETSKCINEIAEILNTMDSSRQWNFQSYIEKQTQIISQAAWFSRSIDCQNFTGKKVVIFGDATHAAAMTKLCTRELGLQVACAGTYCKHDANWFRHEVEGFCDEVLITDDYTQVSNMIIKLEPSAIFGTQMERHIGKRSDIPCGVISAPAHVQNFCLSYRPFLGYEGMNQIADLVYNSLTLGMEDHLLEIFGGHDTKEVITKTLASSSDLSWDAEGSNELAKIPGFVRGKVKRNTEKFARENGIKLITLETLYAAKEQLSHG